MNATLKISHVHLADTAQFNVAAYLATARVAGEVTTNISSVDGRVEYGLAINLFDVTPAQVRIIFRWLRDRFNLGCAYLITEDPAGEDYAGCIKAWEEWS